MKALRGSLLILLLATVAVLGAFAQPSHLKTTPKTGTSIAAGIGHSTEVLSSPRKPEAVAAVRAAESRTFGVYESDHSLAGLVAVNWIQQGPPALTRGTADKLYAPQSAAVFNQSALINWYLGAPRARVAGLGGIDVVAYGDSINEGANTWVSGSYSSYLSKRWTTYLMRRLQAHFNPSTVTGGLGFLPARRGDNTDLWSVTGTEGSGTSPSNAGAQISYNDNGSGTAARQQQISSDGSAREYCQLNGSTATADYDRTKFTGFELVGRRGSSFPTARIDISVGSAPTIGSGGVYAGTVATAGAGVYGKHWGVTSPGGSFSSTANNFISVAGAASGNPLFFDGLVFYNGDEATGVRVHNLSNYGTSIASVDSAGSSFEAMSQFAQTADTDTSTTGASRAKLFIINWETNDIGGLASPSTSLSTFLTSYAAQIDAIKALPSKPAVLLILEPPRGGASQANAEANFRIWNPAIKAMAKSHGACVLDLWQALANGHRSTDLPTTLGFNDSSDNLHFSEAFQAWRADIVFRLLTANDLYSWTPSFDQWLVLDQDRRSTAEIARNNYAFAG